jgi:hypothetical protein
MGKLHMFHPQASGQNTQAANKDGENHEGRYW